ncbi:MAG: hypothetical protein IK088_03820, partial [Lachnospiraceae bacterium]|nr:hypothetical protein [Lachnospiraceae bacterium]
MTEKAVGKIPVAVIVILTFIFSIAAAFFVSLPSAKTIYEDLSAETILPFYLSSQDASYDAGSGVYHVDGSDPSLVFSLEGRSFSVLELQTEKEGIPGDIPVSVYWTRNETEPFIGALSETAVIKKNGTGEAFIKLPSYPVYSLRVDIDGDVKITGLNGLSGNA